MFYQILLNVHKDTNSLDIYLIQYGYLYKTVISQYFERPEDIFIVILLPRGEPCSVERGLDAPALSLTLSQTASGFHTSAVQVFYKHWRKRRNC